MNWKHPIAAVVFWIAAIGQLAAAAPNEFASWVDYRSPDGVFSLSFPSAPVVSSRTISGPAAPVHLTEIKTSNGAFGLVIHQLASAGSVSGDPLDYMTRPNREGRTVDYVKIISLGPVPGREMLSLQEGIWVRERLYWFENRLYNLIALSRTKNEGQEIDRHFFESFRLSSK